MAPASAGKHARRHEVACNNSAERHLLRDPSERSATRRRCNGPHDQIWDPYARCGMSAVREYRLQAVAASSSMTGVRCPAAQSRAGIDTMTTTRTIRQPCLPTSAPPTGSACTQDRLRTPSMPAGVALSLDDFFVATHVVAFAQNRGVNALMAGNMLALWASPGLSV